MATKRVSDFDAARARLRAATAKSDALWKEIYELNDRLEFLKKQRDVADIEKGRATTAWMNLGAYGRARR